MAAIADVFLLVIAACVLLVVGRIWSALRSCWTVTFVFTFLGLAGPLPYAPRIHPVAGLIFAAGLAAQMARFVAARADRFEWWVRRTTLPLAAVVVVLAMVVIRWQALDTRAALANLSPVSPQTPNVLLIVLDTVRAQSLSLYGYPRRTTPQLDRFAKTGVVFDRALSTSSWTLPAHATMFTGRYPYEHSADWL